MGSPSLALQDYVERILDRIFAAAAFTSLDQDITVQSPDGLPDLATLSAAFSNDSGRLDVWLVVEWMDDSYPVWHRYSFNYVDRDGHLVFRHDNSPHFDQSDAYWPHHVHIRRGLNSEIVRACPQPGISLICKRLRDHLQGNGQDI